MTIPRRLQEIADLVRSDGVQPEESVRTILSWFGFQRRGRAVSADIRRALRRLSLSTEPNFETVYLDANVRFVSSNGDRKQRDGSGSAGSTHHSPSEASIPSDSSQPKEFVNSTPSDPTYRIGRLESANKKP